MRRTKIICTLGPSTDKGDVLRQLMIAGMDVARLNFSHQTHKEQKVRVEQVKKLREELHLPIALLLDTKGPEIRLKEFSEPKVFLEAGAHFTLTSRDVVGDNTIAAITFSKLPMEVVTGSKILIDDGLIELRVDSATDTDIPLHCYQWWSDLRSQKHQCPGYQALPPLSLSEKGQRRYSLCCSGGF